MKKKLVSTLLSMAMICTAVIPVGASDFSTETEYVDVSIFQEEVTEAESHDTQEKVDEPLAEEQNTAEQSEVISTEAEEPVEAADPEMTHAEEESDFSSAGSTDASATDVEGNTELDGKCGPYLNYKVSEGTMTIDGTGETYRFGWYPAPEKITNVVFKQGAVEIGEEMFRNFTSLQSVSIPKSITKIESYAFRNCTSLTGFAIPDEITDLGEGIFKDCTGLADITLPKALTSIPDEMFAGCTGLKEFSFTGKISVIGIDAFAGCTSLTGVTFPKNVTTVKTSAFSDCTSLTALTIPKTLTQIDAFAFDGCTGLKTIELEDGVEAIGSYVFARLGDVTVTIPDSVTSIAGNAFYGSEPLIVGYVGSEAETFADDQGFKFKNILAGENTAEEGMCGDEAYYKVNNGIMSIGGSGPMFSYEWYPEADKGNISTVQILKNTVSDIGKYAFEGFTALTEVSIPDTVQTIDAYAFHDCTALTSVTVPDSVSEIGNYAFSGCTSLTSVKISDEAMLNVIGRNAFQNCTALTSVSLPLWMSEIGVQAFYGCSSLTNIHIPDGITEVKTGTFRGTKLKSVTLPAGLKTIGANAFEQTPLTKAEMPGSVTEIRESAFANCTSLGTVTLGDSIVQIGAYAFQGCTSLMEVVLPDTAKIISVYSFAGCTGLKSITIPKTVTTIADHAFAAYTSANTTADNEKQNLSDLTIRGYLNSDAETYANEKKIKFYALDEISSLAAPQLTVVNGSKGTYLTWDLVSGASEYYVYRKLSGGKYARIATLKSYQSSYTDTTAVSNKVYVYAVRAIHGSVKSPYQEKTIRYLTMPVAAVSNTVNGATLTWKAVAGATQYYVYRKTSGTAYARIATLKKAETTYTDKTAVSGTTYTYTVRAISGSYRSAFKDVEKSFVAAPVLKIANGAKGPVLTWTAITNCKQYIVYRKTGTGNYVKLTTTDKLRFQDTTAVSGTAYYYGVVAIIGKANSGMAAVKDIYLSEIKTKVKSVSSGAVVSWTSAAGAKKYVIYRKVNTGKYKKLTSVSAKTFSYTDKTAKKGYTYTYAVRAYNGGSYGPYTEAKVSK